MRLRSPLAAGMVVAVLGLAACDTQVADDDTDITTTDEPGVADEDPIGTDDDAQDGEAVDDTDTDTEATTDDGAAAGDTAEDGSPTGPAAMSVADSPLGEHVVDGEGRTLYVLLAEEAAEPCVGDCAQVWPPVLSAGEPTVQDGIDVDLLGTIELDDGTQQVTFDDRPLHRFVGDAAPGDVGGQGLAQQWFVVAPDGAPIEGTATEARSQTADDTDDDA